MQLIFNIRKIIICTLVLSFFVAPFPSFTARVAEAATEINYQGKLMTSSNVAVPDGLYNMEFKLYTVSSGGSAIWTETRTGASKVQVTSGLFTVLLGSETSLSGINFDQTIYLGVNIGGTGTPSWDGEMSPRKKFASAPSAFVSDTAKALDATYATSTNLYASSTFTNALTINSYSGLLIGTNGLVSAIATSSLGLLTTNVAEGTNLYFTDQRADARVNAVLSATTSLPNITTLAGLTTAGNLATVGTLTSGSIGSGFGNINIGSNTFTGNGSGLTALNASNISTGVLAIARGGTGTTTAPTFGQLLMGNAGGGYDLVATSTLGISSGSGTVNSGTAGQVAFYNSTGTVVSGTSTLFFANGNVGVGSTSPIADFSVQGKAFVGAGQKLLSVVGAISSGSGGGIDLITGSGGDVNIRTQPTSSAGSGSINLTTDNGDEYGGAINMTAGSGFSAGGSLQLTGGNTTGDPIEKGGSITLNPGSGMSVGQDGYINIASTRGNVGIGTTGVSSARLTVKGLASATSILNIASSSGSSLFTFQSNGTFGIGTSTPAALLAVMGTSGASTDLLRVASSTGSPLFVISSAGNIGIGTSTSAYTLKIGSGQSSFPFGSAAQPSVTFNSEEDSGLFFRNSGVGVSSNGNEAIYFENNSAIYFAGQLRPSSNAVASSPAYSFNSDFDTGMYRVGADQIGFSTGGVNRIMIDSTGNIGIGSSTPTARLTVMGTSTSPTTNLLTIASSTGASLFSVLANGNVGVGASSPSQRLVVVTSNSSTEGTLVVSTPGISSGSSATGLEFNYGSAAGNNTANLGRIRGLLEVGGNTGALLFETAPTYNTYATRMSITGAGNIGIGTTTPSKLFTIAGEQYVTGTSTLSNIRFASSTFTISHLNSTTLGDLVFAEGTAGGIKLYAKDNTGASSNIDFRGNNNRVTLTNVDIASAIYSGIQNITTPWLGSTNSSGGDVSWAISKTGNGASQTISALTQVYASSVDGPKLVIGANGIDFAMRDNSAWNEGVDFTAMVIASSTGYVGIGTTTPSTALVVNSGQVTVPRGNVSLPSYSFSEDSDTGIYASASFNNSVLISGGGATGLIVSSSAVYAGTFSAGRYQLQNVAPSASAPSYSFISDTNSGMYQVSSDILGFSTNGTNRLTITDTGNVGIGTTTPSAKLAVTGTAGTGDIFNIASSTEASLFKIGATGATYFNNDAGTLGMVLLSNGTGSSPTWVATSSLGISGGGGGSGTVNSGLTGQVAFYAADGTAVSGTSTLFFANGNVGIGTTTPGSKLHVDGKINVSSGNWYSIDNKVFAFASTTNQSVILGLNAGNLATTSDSALYATAVGIDSLKVLTSGTFNTALGWRTGNGISTGTGNTAVGANAFSSSNGSRNTALGSLSLNQTSGSNNIGIGFQHASYGISGSGNILMGANVLLPSTSGSGQLNIGNVLYGSGLYNSDSTQSSAYSGGRIGIGTTTPSAILAIQGTSTNPTTDLFRVASSTGSPLFAISSAGKVGIGSDPNSLYALSITGGLVITGSANAFGAGAIGISGNALTFAGGSSGYEFRSSANSPQVTISSAGSLGIGTTTPSAKLAVTGTAGTGDIFNIASSTNASLFKIGATGATYFNNDAGTLGMVLLSNGTGSSPTWVATSTLGISGGGGSGTVNSGTAGQVAFYNSTGTAVSGTSTLFFANGNVGIGTTTPGSALTVVGTTTIAGPIRVGMSSNDAVIIGDITGNARGTKAIDIQTRAADTEVASGPTSVAVGYRNRVTGTQGSAFGTENKVDGNYATAVGYYNTANGSKAVALGTENNLGTNLLAIGVGYNNVVSDWYSTAVGYSNTVSAYQSVAVGMNLTNNIAYSYMMGPSQSAAATILSTGEFKAPFFNATSTTGTSTFAGYVGIGTTTPGSLLTVAGNVSITGGITIPVTTSGGLGVVTMGSSRFIHGYGGTQTNVFMGPNAGNLTNTGRDSIGIGSNALVGLTSARLAVAVGSGALERNSSGWSNTAIGESALNFVTTNGNNTAVGRRALYGTTGENNTAIGTQAGESGSSGSNNIYLGYLAGDNLTTGSSNIILGTNIDFASTTASNQLNIGNLIFSQGITGTGTTLSTGNIGIGVSNPAYKLEVNGTSSAQALRLPEFDAGGAGVLFMGSNRFLYGNNGSENTFVGAGAGKLSSPGVANTAVGQGSMINISSGGNYNVALGGTNIRSLTTGDSNIAIGYQTMYDLGTGDNNIAIGRQAGYLITGSNNILLGYQAGKLNSGSTNIVIGYDINAPVGSGSNQLVIGNLIYGTSIDGTNTTVSSGNIGIGTSTPNQKLVVAGTIQATNLLGGSTNLTVDANGNIIRDPSDQGLKENIVTLEGSLAKIEQLRGVRYEWKDKLRFGTSTEIGVIAQEVELVVPEVVSSGGVYKSVNIKNLVALLIEGVKELKVQVDVVKDKVVAISAWFGSGGDSLNVKGQICVDDVCVTKDQFKQILINSGSVMSQPASSGSAGGGTGPSVESGTGTSPSETPSGETGSSAPVNGGAEETGGSSGGDTASSDEAVTPSGSTESAPTTEPTTPPVVSTPPTESVASEPAPAPSPAPTE